MVNVTKEHGIFVEYCAVCGNMMRGYIKKPKESLGTVCPRCINKMRNQEKEKTNVCQA